MKKLWFVVVVRAPGSGPFPIDMLRFDSLVPNTVKDSNVISASFGRFPTLGDRVELRGSGSASWEPAVERWEKFGWRVARVEQF